MSMYHLYMDDKSVFAKRLKDLRKEQHLKQVDVALATGIGRSSLSHYELGESDMTFAVAIKLADYYGVSLDYLAGRKDY